MLIRWLLTVDSPQLTVIIISVPIRWVLTALLSNPSFGSWAVPNHQGTPHRLDNHQLIIHLHFQSNYFLNTTQFLHLIIESKDYQMISLENYQWGLLSCSASTDHLSNWISFYYMIFKSTDHILSSMKKQHFHCNIDQRQWWTLW